MTSKPESHCPDCILANKDEEDDEDAPANEVGQEIQWDSSITVTNVEWIRLVKFYASPGGDDGLDPGFELVTYLKYCR